ncbi:MAG: hypothetical protein NVS9B7_04930 [Flavisolibacter sp.]
MEFSKIHLSPAEIDLFTNQQIILTKNAVIKKIQNLLEQVLERQLQFISTHNLSGYEAFSINPKISKGENYMGLPYIVLDYPRIAEPNNFIFIRTMFWWGHFFSSTLQSRGRNLELVLQGVNKNIEFLKSHYFIGINPEPWHHHFEQTNYRVITSYEEIVKIAAIDSRYVKIGAKWPLQQWPEAGSSLFESWKFLLKMAGLIP